MTSYRPVVEQHHEPDPAPLGDGWFLARAKLKPNPDGSPNKYYGAFPGGFLMRARDLIGCSLNTPVLHVCGGKARFYPYKGFGPADQTLDLDNTLHPDFCQDARDPYPLRPDGTKWDGILIDPPYSAEEATHYAPGSDLYPRPSTLLRRAFEVLRPGGKVGILHYLLPRPPKTARFVACVAVWVGFDNRGRTFAVYEQTE